ncbi:FMN-dependent NADH-azoreductase [Granulosicoccus antarcticus]|uniref:FMN dependent NADH:quinone oxidoreductase n=1 Tax=Granulosicoccus antarcticus IMCC3135 TaxID=1192854 RepID=A0A2Z2P106_9GAMM|nr:NAD(P)H-dependent oxidoreductase [Granulosicoccus antarcticus]ASJ75848.1 FMN-dependent NADH-azoreductase [Granulosicoccus antarcticus IMCC3135]
MNDKKTNNVLLLNSSAKLTGSISRKLAAQVVANLEKHGKADSVVERDLAAGLPFVDENWVNANFTPADQRSDVQKQTLSLSDSLVDELMQADTLVLGVPIYNFGVPATFKAWVDMIARAGKTFQYTATGPEGLIADKKVYLVIASGGTPIGSGYDFASGYVKHALSFVGITDVTIIDAAEVASKGIEAVLQSAEQQISEIDYALSA